MAAAKRLQFFYFLAIIQGNMTKNNLQNIGAVVLSAGKGTRLKSVEIPKVMRQIGGRPMVDFTVETLEKMELKPEQICLVVGFQKEKIIEHFGSRVTYAVQSEQKGTAHAAFTGMIALPKNINQVLVMGGDDSAFYRPETLLDLIDRHIHAKAVLTLLTAHVSHPESLGRIVRLPNGEVEIVEKELLTEEQKKLDEISTGTFVFDRAWFEEIFPTMPTMRKLGEYGLPTALAMAREQNKIYQVITLPNPDEWFGVNTLEELAEANKRKLNI